MEKAPKQVSEVDMYKTMIAEMQKEIHHLQLRVKVLTDDIDILKRKG